MFSAEESALRDGLKSLDSLGILAKLIMKHRGQRSQCLCPGMRLLLAGLCLLAAMGHSASGSPRAGSGADLTQIFPSAGIAIADFDGDRLPDQAMVEVVRDATQFTSYSIHLKLSGGAESQIRISAQAGGLQIYPRDINGDSQIDLIVRTEVGPQVVAVLLNDGHGHFRPADLKSFGWIQDEKPLDSAESTLRLGGDPGPASTSRVRAGADPEFAPVITQLAPRRLLLEGSISSRVSTYSHSPDVRGPPAR